MTGRETFLDVSDSVMAAPGPGQYDPGIIQERVRGGHTLANKVLYFKCFMYRLSHLIMLTQTQSTHISEVLVK